MQDEYEYEDDDGLLEDDSFVRPFIITGGRGESSLPVEVMVMSAASFAKAKLPVDEEYASIFQLCREAQSIAEISARCKLPLGVIRVMVGDLVELGALTVAAHDKLDVVDELAFLDRIIAAVEHI